MDLFTRQASFSDEPHRQVSSKAVIRTLSIGFEGRVRPQANIPIAAWRVETEGCREKRNKNSFEKDINGLAIVRQTLEWNSESHRVVAKL